MQLPAGHVFCAVYEDTVTVKLRSDWIKANHLGGIMYYDITGGYDPSYPGFSGVDQPLLALMKRELGSAPAPPTAPTASSSGASSITQTAATLNGTVNANGASTTVRFVWGTTSGVYTDSLNASQSPVGGSSPTPVSRGLTGLVVGTTYYYNVRAYNSAGNSQGSELSFTTNSSSVSAPTASTGSTTSITSNSATANGTVNANGASTTVRFVWGTTSGVYTDSLVASQSPVGGTANTAVSIGLTGLSFGTTYYVRVRAYNSAGNSQGNQVSFTTSALAPTATTDAATSISQTTALLNGSVSANGASTIVRFVWGLASGAYTDSVTAVESPILGNSPVSAGVEGLTEATTYYFRVKAYNSAGVAQGSERTFTTFLPGGQGIQDITAQASPIALITSPTGAGNHDIEVTRDGNTPPVGSSNVLEQYDTFTGGGARAFDWIGYQFSSSRQFTSLVYEEGLDNQWGGCFVTLGVQVRVGGVWSDVPNLVVNPPYGGNNLVNYETYELSFDPVNGDAIRIAGTPTGSAHYIGVGELRVFGAMPLAPQLISPLNGAVNESTWVTLRWVPASGATSHHLQVARDSMFTALVFDDSTVADSTRQVGSLLHQTLYYWKVRSRSIGGYSTFSSRWSFTTRSQTGVGGAPYVPKNYDLRQNYPNPFNPTTTIVFSLPKSGHIRLTIANLLGQEIETLIDGDLSEGVHSAVFDAGTNIRLTSGIYFYRLEAGDFVDTKKLVLLK
jgi:hypothetical protein